MLTVRFYWHAVCGIIFCTWPNHRMSTIEITGLSVVISLIVVGIANSRHAARRLKIAY